MAVEHQVRDGGSKDGGLNWLASQNDLSVVSKKDKGMYYAIAEGWSDAQGEVLSWLNSDEQYLPGTLAKVAKAFASHPGVDAVFGDALIVDPGGKPIAARREIPMRSVYVRNSHLYGLSCTIFFRRKLWDAGLLRFNDGFQVAADMDLVLQLLAQGRSFFHMREYLALFTVGLNNLSVSERATSEIAEIRRAHSGLRNSTLRQFVLVGRFAEKLLAGCYRAEPVGFDYALDEIPSYVRIEAQKVGNRFRWPNPPPPRE